MTEKVHLFKLVNHSPFIQLVATFLIVFSAGTLLFYLFIYMGSLVFGTGTDKMLLLPYPEAELKEIIILRYVQVSQQVSLFIVPSLILAQLLGNENESFLKTNKLPDAFSTLLVFILAFLILPITSYTGMLNSKMNFPDWFSEIERWIRAKEETASDLTGILISSPNFVTLTINIFIMAVIPALGEELLFRGVIQQILCRMFRSGHIGIWITAILFSFIHFQFFGFLPRLILGLSFGYLFYWSRNIWLPILAHFINNGIPVVISYFIGWKELSEKTSELTEKQIFLPIIPAALIVLIFYYFSSEYREKINENSSDVGENIK